MKTLVKTGLAALLLGTTGYRRQDEEDHPLHAAGRRVAAAYRGRLQGHGVDRRLFRRQPDALRSSDPGGLRTEAEKAAALGE
jgi:hypothetical protein